MESAQPPSGAQPKRPSLPRQEEEGDAEAELPSREDDDDEIADLIDIAAFDVSEVFKAVEGRMSIAEERARASLSLDGQATRLQEQDPTSTAVAAAPAPEPHEVFSNTFGKIIPETPLEVAKAEEMLAAEMANMSMAERDKIMFEMHGISSEVFDETPESVDAALQELEQHLKRIPAASKEAYEKAKYINPDYVNDREFRLMFLRAEVFDCEKAALKMVKHFTIKQELWGDGEILCRDIRQSDMNEEDLKTLRSGFLQVLPNRDAAGRAVIIFAPEQKTFKVVENIMKTMWYMMSNCLKDDETQKKGVVVVIYALGRGRDDLDVMRRVHWAREGMPKRIVGIHHCTNDDSLKPFFLSVKMYLLNKQLRSRLRPHQGPQSDVMFELQTFGIPVNEQLLRPNGSLSLAWHRDWLEIRKAQEDAAAADQESSKGVIVPRRFDVLFGRGKNTREHTGNLRCVHLVEMNQARYEAANKYEKTEIAERIVTIVHESYGRFLKWDNKEGWVEVDRDAAREKISHFFRHLRSKKTAEATPVPKTEEEQKVSKRVSPCPSPMIDPASEPDRSAKQVRSNGANM